MGHGADLPESVVWFISQLRASGFAEAGGEKGGMDSELIVFRRESVEIRLVKDRSQWSVDLFVDGWRKQDRVHFPLLHGFALE